MESLKNNVTDITLLLSILIYKMVMNWNESEFRLNREASDDKT